MFLQNHCKQCIKRNRFLRYLSLLSCLKCLGLFKTLKIRAPWKTGGYVKKGSADSVAWFCFVFYFQKRSLLLQGSAETRMAKTKCAPFMTTNDLSTILLSRGKETPTFILKLNMSSKSWTFSLSISFPPRLCFETYCYSCHEVNATDSLCFYFVLVLCNFTWGSQFSANLCLFRFVLFWVS